ncbi:MAG TPA: tRNA (adenosine(37)-N6)-threonylcarbamoyltransferase complex dimerization subunit type 1 TsaB [Daejeonella sp.]|nr:tRNA (adenosine(37)-N6)-threonylcarbamoyltransferase complex dimerization subunit type 1 TsaB [Daejeonella sp.]
MKLILLIETATTSCSVALAGDDKILALKEVNERNIHASHITLFIEEVMQQAGKSYSELDAVAISKGPGSYTGLRIGVSTAKGLCFALDIPLVAVDTLQAMASGVRFSEADWDADTLFCPMIDARRMEVYTALFDQNLDAVLPTEAKILDEHTFDQYLDQYQIVFFGDGSEKCKALYAERNNVSFTDFQNSAAHLSHLAFQKLEAGQTEDVAYFEPFYLKDFIAGRPANS